MGKAQKSSPKHVTKQSVFGNGVEMLDEIRPDCENNTAQVTNLLEQTSELCKTVFLADCLELFADSDDYKLGLLARQKDHAADEAKEVTGKVDESQLVGFIV